MGELTASLAHEVNQQAVNWNRSSSCSATFPSRRPSGTSVASSNMPRISAAGNPEPQL